MVVLSFALYFRVCQAQEHLTSPWGSCHATHPTGKNVPGRRVVRAAWEIRESYPVAHPNGSLKNGDEGTSHFAVLCPFPPPPPPFVTYVRAFPPVPCPLCLVKPCQRASFSFPWRPGLAWTGLDSSFLGYFSFVAPKDGPKPPPLSPSPQRNTRPLIPRGAPKRTHPFFLFLLTHPLPTPSPPLSSTPTTHPHTEQPWPAWS